MFVSKLLLVAIGLVLYIILTYITFSWIRKTHIGHFHSNMLPPVIQNKKISRILMVIAALFVGAMGSSIVQGIGWEPLLKFLNHASFDQKDPYFHMDISIYMFIIPFVKIIIYILIGLSIFFLGI